MEPASDPTPEAAFRSNRVGQLTTLLILVPLSIAADILRTRGDPVLWAIGLWTIVITAAVFVSIWALYGSLVARIVSRVKAQYPHDLVFVTRRVKALDIAMDQLTDDKGFNVTYASAVVADADHLTIVSRRGGTISIAWSRILDVRAGVTRDSRIFYPALIVTVRGNSDTVTVPLAASLGPWFFFTPTRPRVIRKLVDDLGVLRRGQRVIP